ncbi:MULTISPECIES: CGNR zinc finger domain-containing protein [Kitasatospora]|uniref:CGNR zinc finger domain-containing protein n=1 Tax=Kitasatospora cystarginea TaxID=58350 RepID=A0ABP5RLK4_9ACTN
MDQLSASGPNRRPDPLPPAPGEEHSVALALVNTRTVRSGAPVDALDTPEAATSWLAEHTTDEGELRLDTAAAAGLRELREAIRALLAAAIGRTDPPRSAVDTLNGALRAAPTVSALDWPSEDRPRRRAVATGGDQVARALSGLAEDALGLLCGSDAQTLAACPADGCVRLLLRSHGRRQWCSTRCGDRVRAARHYARRRTAGID